MLFRRKKPSPDPALELDFRRQMGRKSRPREMRWIELADEALSEGPKKKPPLQPADLSRKAA